MTPEQRAIEFEALVGEIQVINIEVMGMRFENEGRLQRGESLAYLEREFYQRGNDIVDLIAKLRSLK